MVGDCWQASIAVLACMCWHAEGLETKQGLSRFKHTRFTCSCNGRLSCLQLCFC